MSLSLAIPPVHPDHSNHKLSVKCVVVGDGAVGKTNMLESFISDFYEPRQLGWLDKVTAAATVNGKLIAVEARDTPGQEEGAPLRRVFYSGADVFIVCYSVQNSTSLENVRNAWIPEIRKHCPKVPFLLVGAQNDVRSDEAAQNRLRAKGRRLVDVQAAVQTGADVGAAAVMECSAKTREGVDEVFAAAIILALRSADAAAGDDSYGGYCVVC